MARQAGIERLLALRLALLACSNADAILPSIAELHRGFRPVAQTAPCAEGTLRGEHTARRAHCAESTLRSCSVKFGKHDERVACFAGTQVCQGGVLGECRSGYSYAVHRPTASSTISDRLRSLAFSPAVDCRDNPCNAYCRQFLERPEAGFSPEIDESAPALPWWPVGRLDDSPEASLAPALHEPFEVSADCQQGTECIDPALGRCSHSVCVPGEALPHERSRCADAVCAQHPTCCGVAPVGDHDPCDSSGGQPLDALCDRCVAAVCDKHPECCDANWTEDCVAFVATECKAWGQSCGCLPGTERHLGRCYALTPSAQDLDRSHGVCVRNFRTPFRLADIAGAAEEDRVRSLLASNALAWTWLGAHATGIEEWTWQRTSHTFFEGHAGDPRPSDEQSEGTHYWGNGSCRHIAAFAEDQPNDTVAPGSKQCAVVMLGDSQSRKWEDRSCNDDALAYACEGPVRDPKGACDQGQLEGPDGACYWLEATERTWDDARAHCESLGDDWGLATIAEEAVHDFLAAWFDCEATWLANPPAVPRAPQFWRAGATIELAEQRPYMGLEGEWLTDPPLSLKASVCRGPRSSSALTAVDGAEACRSDSEFYFESRSPPDRLSLCPDTCSRVSTLGAAPLRVAIPCREPSPPALPTTRTERYPSDCEGPSAHWDFLDYQAITPADSQVRVALRNAPTETALATSPFLTVASAVAIDGTEACQISPPNCPIDLFHALGFPDQQHAVLELQIQFVPGTIGEAPRLRDWDVRFSCPPNG